MSLRDVSQTYFVNGYLSGSVTASAGSQLVVRENPYRKNFCITNDTPDPLFLRFFDGNASSALYNIRVPSYTLYELMKPPVTGAIHVAFGGVSGSAKWIELS